MPVLKKRAAFFQHNISPFFLPAYAGEKMRYKYPAAKIY